MIREDIIRMAREAADETGTLIPTYWNDPLLERFAALVAAAEREACAKVCEDKNTLLAWPTYAAAIRARGTNHG
jgi:hypothetical protein